ncbi:MAG: RecB family endonuclease NucS [Candidatus Methanohalarchaeum thermophilum]|uniref:Endonuclease NucS n=1 Tax=Methanohalarchaeum thermophilum TaxID=1903181 RepID=A0A1Q6DTP9_METT1|nr:MAG: RecB family endonuclease NucS [Candidatus Methanohalarchaeum thermophilum]
MSLEDFNSSSKPDKVIYSKVPSKEKAFNLIEFSLKNDRLIDIFGKCEIDYEGRASSYLAPGDRLTIVKPDGTLIVHKREKREPVNWQPPKSRNKVDISNENLVLTSRRRKPKEKLEITYEKIFSISSLLPEDEKEIQLNRSEEEMGDLIIEKPWIIEKGFKIIEREKETDLGYIDIFGKDKNQNRVIIELKRKKISLSDISQLKRYQKSLKKDYNNLRGVIVGPSISKKAENLLKEEKLEFTKLKPEVCDLGTDLTEFQ